MKYRFDRKNPKGVSAAELENGWVSEQLYSSAREYYESLLVDIGNARSSVDLAVYIFSLDLIGQRFVDAMVDAAKRGVEVRLLIDGVGSADDGDLIASQLSAAGAKVHIYHPLPWYIGDYRWSLQTGAVIEKFFHFISFLNRRDHRKFCVIDNETCWCGSFNITREHLDESDPWRDYAVRLTGKPVQHLTDNFNSVWFCREQKSTAERWYFFRSNTSMRLRRIRNRLLVNRIRNARDKVWICSAYFAPSRSVIKAIKFARLRNIDVRLIVAGRSDVRVFPLLSATYYADLLKLGVSIYCYQKGILHAKAMLVDDECIIGSANFNYRSFYHDLELDVVLSHVETTRQLQCLLKQDMDNSKLLVLDDVPVWSRALAFGWILRIVRYWM